MNLPGEFHEHKVQKAMTEDDEEDKDDDYCSHGGNGPQYGRAYARQEPAGEDEFLRQMNPQERALFRENQKWFREYTKNANKIPKGHKVLATDVALDSWIAAHYEFPNNKLPSSRPATIPVQIYERLKHYYGKDKDSLALRDLIKKKGWPSCERDENDSMLNDALPGGYGDYNYRESPAKTYKMVTYPQAMKVKDLSQIHQDSIEAERRTSMRKGSKKKLL